MIIFIGQIIFIALAVIGGITVIIILPVIITEVIMPPIRNFLTRKCKFRFLCKHEYVSTESDTYRKDMPLGLYYLSFKFINNDYSFLLGIVNNRIGKKTIVANIMYLENEFLFSGQINPCTYISSVEVNAYFQNQGIYKKMCEAFIQYVDYDQHIVVSRESEMGKKCRVFDTLKTTLITNGFQKKVLNDKYFNRSELCDEVCEKEHVLQKCKDDKKF